MPVPGKTRTRGRTLRCEDCGRKYKCERWLNAHMLSHIKESETNFFICTKSGCQKRFNEEANFILHQNWHKTEARNRTIKALNKIRKHRRKQNVLRYPCMFCDFRTLSRIHVERHMEVRHNSRYKKAIKLVRAHADALEIQHHQMLLALEIEDTVVNKLPRETLSEIYVPNNPTICEPKAETLCDCCGLIFRRLEEFHQHRCNGLTVAASATMLRPTTYYPLERSSYNYSFNGTDTVYFSDSTTEVTASPLDLSCNAHKSQSTAVSSSDGGETIERGHFITLFSENNTVSSVNARTTVVDEAPVTFTFQDLLILEQNLAPLYL